MEGSGLGFIIRATYDVLPTPKNLSQWVRQVLAGSLPNPSNIRAHSHWLQNQFVPSNWQSLWKEGEQPSKSSLFQCPNTQSQLLARPSSRAEATLCDPAQDWKMQVDLDQKLSFLTEIISETNIRLDLIL